MKMEGFSLLLLLCAALLCPLPGIAAPQDSDSTTQANKNTEDPTDDFPVKPDMGDNTTAGIAYTGTPYIDFTPFTNSNNSLESIMAELMQAGIGGGYQEQGQRSTRSCACTSTNGAYGGGGGGSFVDITTNPCDVEIRTIYIRRGGIVDAIQVQYQQSNGQLYTAPWRGGNGGGLTTISVHSGEKVIGMFGSTGVHDGITVVSHLYILKQTTSGSVEIYGPYGNAASANTFVVFGDIKSIFGRSGYLLDAIGFYYEPWGAC